MQMEIIDRYKGCLLGLATGDALGTTLEFARPGNFLPITDIVGGGPFELEAGKWTDDTSMALCLAASLTEKKDFNTFDQMEKYYSWYRDGYMSSVQGHCVDIGNTTREALHEFSESGQAICGPVSRKTAGNGSLMRLGSVPMFFRKNTAEAINKSGISSKTTHSAPQAIDACRYFAYLLLKAFNGEEKKSILSDLSQDPVFSNVIDHEIIEIVQGSFKRKSPPEIVSSGYVVKSLEAALWAFYHTDSFKDGALKAVNLGNDADTVGAIYGQIAGAFYGVGDIPSPWLQKLYRKDEIERMAAELFKLSELS